TAAFYTGSTNTTNPKFFELELTPAGGSGVTVNASTLTASDLHITVMNGTTVVNGITIVSVEQVLDGSTPTNRFRFYYSGTLAPPSATQELTITVEMDAGAWADSEGNTSAQMTQTFTVHKPGQT